MAESDGNLSQTNMTLLAEMMKSVGAVMGSSPEETIGTCFRVGDDLVMTSYHSIKNIVEKDPNTALTVVFDEYLLHQTRKYRELNYIYDDKMDFAILQLDNCELPKAIPLISTFNENNVTKVALIGFGNAYPYSKQFEPPCKLISKYSPEIQNAMMYVQAMGKNPDEEYDGWNLHDNMLLNCWQTHGASGAPLIDVTHSGSLGVVGILTGGLPKFYWSLQENERRQFPDDYRFEVGTKMSSILCCLRNSYPELADRLIQN